MDITWHVKHMKANQMIAIAMIFALASGVAIVVRGIPLSSDFKSGTLIRVTGLDNRPDATAVGQSLNGLLNTDVSVTITSDNSLITGKFGFEAEVGQVIAENEDNQIIDFISTQFPGSNTLVLPRGSFITTLFKNQAYEAVIVAFILMSVVLFIAFRQPAAVGVMILCVAFDALAALGGMALFQVPLSFGSIAALLMIIGYSVDTDILLSNHMLKRTGGEPRGHASNAMITGLMTQGSTLVALIAINVLTTASLLFQLSIVLIFGLVGDIINTWFLNVGVLLRSTEGQKKREYYVSD
jgi:preprotein translocase subunit SecF